MGRVDEAMRRAAEQRAGEAPRLAGEPLLDSEAFPRETAERPRLRTVPSVTEAVMQPQPVGSAGAHPKGPLFDRLDVGLERKTVADDHLDPISREQYRRLAATLHANQAETGIKVILVASALANEGKTLTAANLALTFSESYHRNVLLIDGDLRKPSLHKVFNIDAAPGLSESVTLDERRSSFQRVSERLAVLTAGRASVDPMATLVSDRARGLIEDARRSFDWVIIDTPPITLLSDASLLSTAADGTVFVVKAGETPYELVRRAVAVIGRERILGVVLNGVTDGLAGLSRKYYGSYYAGRSASAGGGS